MAKQRATILGGGSFGTALANIVAQNGHPAYLWVRDEQQAAKVQAARENVSYLPSYPLHDNLTVSSALHQCVSEADIVVIAVPSSGYRDVVKAMAPSLHADTLLVSATKGVQSPDFTLMSQILEQELDHSHIGVLSGPNFAKEIVQGHHTGSVIASDSPEVLKHIPAMFSSATFRVYTNDDRFGVELAGALKNIYAIISGMANALGCGHNTQAMLVTRSLAEMGRFAERLGANYATFLGLAGVGDLILTCGSNLSRNYRIGHLLGEGKTLSEAVKEVGQVAEGVNTLKMVKHKADTLGVYMPLVSGLNAILFEDQDIASVVQQLMGGEMNKDVEFDQP